jgi:tetratricopeptide (TPR) repeat protein
VAQFAERKGPAADRPRFLGIFQQVCQTLAYAHARGVIHRDLKPGNVMVGAFGEVQVMDWGLAKVLKEGGVADERKVQPPEEVSVIRTARSTGSGSESRVGSVFGTPAYMAPEQARGAVDRLDERCDVFGLGAILCQLLTGQPPYTGRDSDEVYRKAAAGDTAEALARLTGCGADPELVEIAKHCLADGPAERPRHAGELAQAVTAYQDSVAERLRQAELDRAAESARAEEAKATAVAERRARRLTLGLAAAVLLLDTAGAAGGLWAQRQQAERVAEAARLRQTTEAALDKAQALQQQARWAEARTVLEQTRDRLGESGPADLRRRVEQAAADLALVGRLEAIRLKLATVSVVKGKPWTQTAEREYAAAFRQARLGEEGQPAEAVAGRIRAAAVREHLVAALDDWAAWTPDGPRRAWLLEVARRADPDPWRDRFRDPKVRRDRAALEKLAAELLRDEARLKQLTPHLLTALGNELRWAKGDAVPLLVAAQAQNPGDFWLNFRLGIALAQAERWAEAAGYYRGALAARPDAFGAHNNLGNALVETGDVAAAIASYRRALDLDPNYPGAHHNLGIALAKQGDVAAAIASYRRALKLSPDDAATHYDLGVLFCDVKRDYDRAAAHFRQALATAPKDVKAHTSLGNALQGKGDVEGAVASYRRALDLDPEYATAYVGLGIALNRHGDVEGAVASFRRALELDPDSAAAHLNFGALLCDVKHDYDRAADHFRRALELAPKDATGHRNLGNALVGKGDMQGAAASFRRALELDPKNVITHYGLGNALRAQGDLDAAITSYRAALALEPRNAPVRTNLGATLRARGKLDEAIREYRTAIDHDPKHARAHYNLGNALADQKQFDAAITSYRAALALEPRDALAHNALGNALRARGKSEEAVKAYRAAIDLNPAYFPAHFNLGNALMAGKQWPEAAAAYRAAVALDPRHTAAHYALGFACARQGDVQGAIVQYRRVIELDPNHRQAHLNLGVILCDVKHDYDGAIPLFRRAVALDPNDTHAHYNLGTALSGKGDIDGAIQSYRRALELDPSKAVFHNGLGGALAKKGNLEEAEASFRRALQLDPQFALAHINLGTALRLRGEFAEALAALQRGHDLGSRQKGWTIPSAELVRQARALADLDRRAAAILKGEAKSKSPAELLRLGRFCLEQKKHPAAAARLYADALAAEPALADDLAKGDRLAAAQAAALAGCGRGRDAATVGDVGRAQLRRQALSWLRADLVLWQQKVGGAEKRTAAREALGRWQRAADLAGVRDSGALARLPEAEREAWRQLWADVSALRKQAETPAKGDDHE